MAEKMAAKPDAIQANMIARRAVLSNSLPMTQQIDTVNFTGTDLGNPINIGLQNVGLVTHLTVEIEFDLVQADAETLSRTELGAANVLSKVQLTDFNNQTRISTSGWHMHYLASARRMKAFGAAFTNDSPTSMGSNMEIIHAASSITTSDKVRMFYEIPLAYGPSDLRGALYASVVNATANLQLTLNPNMVVASTANPTEAVYISDDSNTGAISGGVIKVYQHYLDQLPQGQNGPVLPLIDLANVYLMNNTTKTGLTANSDMQVPYANFRSFLSTFLLYDDFGSSAVPPASVNSFSIQSANYTNIIDIDPYMAALMTRQILGDDMPAEAGRALWYFDHRRKPINTVNYGNMQLIANLASVEASTSRFLMAYEAITTQNQVVQAGSLYGNN